jgi:hypothetical protein
MRTSDASGRRDGKRRSGRPDDPNHAVDELYIERTMPFRGLPALHGICPFRRPRGLSLVAWKRHCAPTRLFPCPAPVARLAGLHKRPMSRRFRWGSPGPYSPEGRLLRRCLVRTFVRLTAALPATANLRVPEQRGPQVRVIRDGHAAAFALAPHQIDDARASGSSTVASEPVCKQRVSMGSGRSAPRSQSMRKS